MRRVASQEGYVFIKGHKRTEGSDIAHSVAKILDSYFTGEVYHGYEPDTIKVMFFGDIPLSLRSQILNKIEDSVKELSKNKIYISLELP